MKSLATTGQAIYDAQMTKQSGASKIFLQMKDETNQFVDEANLVIEIIFTPQNQPQVFVISRFFSTCSFCRFRERAGYIAGQPPPEAVYRFIDEIFTAIARPQTLAARKPEAWKGYQVSVIWENYPVPELGNSGRLDFKAGKLPAGLAQSLLRDLQGESEKTLKKLIRIGLRRLPAAIADIGYEFSKALHAASHPINQPR